ncbi:MAG: hypothetical protein HY986_08445 [Candidatus Melainabacteria bacterium]|nr:hypothetical protein [Candidatus Melainabacteria bacterium]
MSRSVEKTDKQNPETKTNKMNTPTRDFDNASIAAAPREAELAPETKLNLAAIWQDGNPGLPSARNSFNENPEQNMDGLIRRNLLSNLQLVDFETSTLNEAPHQAAPESAAENSESTALEQRDESTRRLQEQFGVTISYGQEVAVSLPVGGAERTLLTLPADTPPAEIERRLAQLRENQIRHIESNFAVDILPAGSQVIIPQSETESSNYHTRAPGFDELAGLEAALMRSQPTSLAINADRIPVSFMQESGRGNTRASYLPEPMGGPAIHVWPASMRFPATQSDDTRNPENIDRQRGLIRGSLEEIITHEYGHRLADDLDILSQENSDIARELGFHRLPSPAANAGSGAERERWSLIGRDGYYYEQYADGWHRVDSQGTSIDENGQSTDPKGAFRVAPENLAEHVAVAPSSHYTTNPNEVFAEGVTYYRLNQSERASFLQRSPELYRVIQRYDQMELDRAYGTNPDGSSRYLRRPDGTIVENSESSRRLIAEFEGSATRP